MKVDSILLAYEKQKKKVSKKMLKKKNIPPKKPTLHD